MKSNTARHILEEDSIGNGKDRIPCRPFVKWVGGKGQLLVELRKRIPPRVKRYYEPFIGGGALLFNYQPRRAYISDINFELINAYQVIKNDVESLIKSLKKHVYDEKYFYMVRNADRQPDYESWSSVERTSRLIFLNKTCYNGLYRVNSKGQFNTPFGRYTNPTILNESNLRACSRALRNVTIHLASFEGIEKAIKRGDFVYFDPPYVPLSTTAYFTSYSREGFDINMQKALFDLCCRLDKRGIRFMLSNSSAPFVVRLYKRFKVEFVSATRAINSKASKRGKIDEVIVTNY